MEGKAVNVKQEKDEAGHQKKGEMAAGVRTRLRLSVVWEGARVDS